MRFLYNKMAHKDEKVFSQHKLSTVGLNPLNSIYHKKKYVVKQMKMKGSKLINLMKKLSFTDFPICLRKVLKGK
jgi:hypothetical protein